MSDCRPPSHVWHPWGAPERRQTTQQFLKTNEKFYRNTNWPNVPGPEMYVEYTYSYVLWNSTVNSAVLHSIADTYGMQTYRPYCVHFPPKNPDPQQQPAAKVVWNEIKIAGINRRAWSLLLVRLLIVFLLGSFEILSLHVHQLDQNGNLR